MGHLCVYDRKKLIHNIDLNSAIITFEADVLCIKINHETIYIDNLLDRYQPMQFLDDVQQYVQIEEAIQEANL